MHGTFSPEYEPVLTIDSGDTVLFETMDPGWNLSAPWESDGDECKFEPRDSEHDAGHALCVSPRSPTSRWVSMLSSRTEL